MNRIILVALVVVGCVHGGPPSVQKRYGASPGNPRAPLVLIAGQVHQLAATDYMASPGGVSVDGSPAGPGDIETTTLNGAPVAAGSVTSITAAAPLTGGTITGIGTIGLTIGSGLTTAASALVADMTVVQHVLTSGCVSPNAIISVGTNGAVTCSTGVSTLTNGAGNNVLPKSNGTNLVASSLSDNGTTVLTSEAVTATGAVTGSAGVISNGNMGIGSVITPATLAAGTYQDYSPVDGTTSAAFSTASEVDITITGGGAVQLCGMTAGYPGRIVTLRQISTGTFTMYNENGCETTPANRFNSDAILESGAAGGSFTFYYDGALSRWSLIGSETGYHNIGTNFGSVLSVQGQLSAQGGEGVTGGANAFINFANGSAAAASAANTGSITYQSASQAFYASLNGAAAALIPTTVAGTTNALVKYTGTNGAQTNSSITDNGTTVTTTEAVATGSVTATGTVNATIVNEVNSGTAYMTSNTLDFASGTNASTLGYINYYGYNIGVTQFRDLEIGNGKGAQVAYFTGSTNGVEFNGAIKGDSTLSAASVRTGGTTGPLWSSGTGAPGIACNVGDLFSRTDGGTTTTLYVCTASNTWTGK